MAMRLKDASLLRTCLAASALIAVAGGCNKEPKLRPGWTVVSGTILHKGKPLPAGEVIWCVKKDGVSVMRGGPLREDGTYSIDAPIGSAQVAIHNADVKNVRPGSYIQIPKQYTDPEQSGLTYELKAGENKDVNFDLQ
jgi:hypothetical protein